MTEHHLKIWNNQYWDIVNGIKTAEVRYNDRDYRQGDTIVFKLWDPIGNCYLGLTIARQIADVQDLTPFGIPGFVLMEIRQ